MCKFASDRQALVEQDACFAQITLMVGKPACAVQRLCPRPRSIRRGSERLCQPAPALGVIAAAPPKPAERAAQSERGIAVLLETPCQCGAQIVVLSIQAIH